MTDTTYNGWKNYETWLVTLWIDNDEPTQNAAREIAANVAEHNPSDGVVSLLPGYWTNANVARWRNRKAGSAIREMLEEENGPLGMSENELAHDLIQSALDAVDWEEVGAHYAPEPSTVHDEDGDA